jgi:hypothetical protein
MMFPHNERTHMLRKFIFSFFLALPFAINAQTLDDSNYFSKQFGELTGERQELIRVMKNLNSTEYELGKDLLAEYNDAAAQIDSLSGYIYLYSLLPQKEKKIANEQFMKTTFQFYLAKSNFTLQAIALIQGTTKLPFLNQSAENLKKKVQMSRTIVASFRTQ